MLLQNFQSHKNSNQNSNCNQSNCYNGNMEIIASALKALSNISDLVDFQVKQGQIRANRAATANRATAFTEVLSRYCSTALACTPVILSVWQSNFVSKNNTNSLILKDATSLCQRLTIKDFNSLQDFRFTGNFGFLKVFV